MPEGMKQYGAMMNEEAKALLTKKALQAVQTGRAKFLEMKKLAENGHYSWQAAGFLAGALIVVNSILSIMSHILSLSPLLVTLDVYLLVFGACACILECKEKVLSLRYIRLLQREALFLFHPYGRAAFYIFVGGLIAAEQGMTGFLIGGYCMFIGSIIYSSSSSTFAKLAELRTSIQSERLENYFMQYDKDGSGYFESSELGQLTRALGAHLSLHELESALFILDKNGDGRVSMEEFKQWWCEREDFLA